MLGCGELHLILEVGDPGRDRFFLEARLVGRSLDFGESRPCGRHRAAGRLRRDARVLEPRLHVGERLIERLEAGFRRTACVAFTVLLDGQTQQLLGDLLATVSALRLVVPQPLQCQLSAMKFARHRPDRLAHRCERRGRLRHRGVRLDRTIARVVGQEALRARALGQVVDLVQPREQTRLLRIGRVQLKMVASDLMAVPRHEDGAGL